MLKITDEFIKDIVGEGNYQDGQWEIEDFVIAITKDYIKENDSHVYQLDIIRLKDKFNILITITKDYKKLVGFCPCAENNKSGTCKHIAMALMTIQDREKNLLIKSEVKKTDRYKMELLRMMYEQDSKKDELNIEIVISDTGSGKMKIGFNVAKIGQQKYLIKNIDKFLTDVENKDELNLGKMLVTNNYYFDNKSKELINYIKVLNNQYSNLNIDAIEYTDYFPILLKLINMNIIYKKEEYQIKDRLSEIVLDVKCEGKGLKISLKKTDYYEKLVEDIYINEANKIIYILDQSQLCKINLLNSFFKEDKIFFVNEKDKPEFIKEILPNIFNEFVIKLDKELGINIIDEKLNITLYCFLEDKLIHIHPEFLYGEYDANKINNEIVIKRNYHEENDVLTFLQDLGYQYDSYRHDFVIQANRHQFNFLTKNIFDIKQKYNIQMEDKLKNAILNFDTSNIKVSLSKKLNLDYFEFNFDLDQIKKEDIVEIIKSYELKKEFHRLDDGMFIKLNDKKLFEQLKFLNDIMLNHTHTLNNYRIPKYKAILIKEKTSFLFSDSDYNPEFMQYIDEIKNITPLDNTVFEDSNFKLRKYQKSGVEWLTNLYKANIGALLSDEMGLGKTIQVIAFLKINKISEGLIIVPKALLYNWKREFQKFNPGQLIKIIDGPKDKRHVMITKLEANVIYITSYNSLINDYDDYQDLYFPVVIIDEAQYIKNSITKTSRVTKQIKGEFFIAMTGTPIENNLNELWSIFDFIIPGFLSDATSFSKQFSDDSKEVDILKKAINPFIMRRLKKDVLKELPDKIITDVICELAPKQKTLYAKFIEDYKKEIINTPGENVMQALTALTRLRQMSIHPSLFLDNYDETPGKLEVFEELITEITENKEKVIVFSQYTTMLSILKDKLEELDVKYFYLDGKTPPKQRLMDVEKFNKSSIPVYLISLKAGGTGLNLTSAKNVIIFDPWWNPAVEIQAIDRTHRIGQEEVVQVFRLLSRHTIEEKINILQKTKIEILNNVIDNDETFISKLSHNEIKELLMTDFTIE